MTPERVMEIARECGATNRTAFRGPDRRAVFEFWDDEFLTFAARIREEAMKEAANCAYSACYYGIPGLDREGNKNIGQMVQGTILSLIEKKP